MQHVLCHAYSVDVGHYAVVFTRREVKQSMLISVLMVAFSVSLNSLVCTWFSSLITEEYLWRCVAQVLRAVYCVWLQPGFMIDRMIRTWKKMF